MISLYYTMKCDTALMGLPLDVRKPVQEIHSNVHQQEYSFPNATVGCDGWDRLQCNVDLLMTGIKFTDT